MAKRLRLLYAPDAATAQRLGAERQAGLLLAETLCPDPVPGPPSRLLLGAGAAAVPALRDVAGDQTLPVAVRALAALTLGAVRNRAGDDRLPSPLTPAPSCLRRAFAWGRREGLPGKPALVAVFLADGDGEDLARHWRNARLSAGGINAFSTVPNAVEQNKRVLYAADGAGRIVGRKLIGIDADNALIGYHTYTSVSGEASAALRAAVRRYLLGFAARCGLPLADAGTVPILFAEDWYDDGAVPWDDETDPEPLCRGQTHRTRAKAGVKGRGGPV